MEDRFREKQQKSYTLMRMTYDLTMAILILGMAAVLFFAEQFKIQQIMDSDLAFRYMFGGICTFIWWIQVVQRDKEGLLI